MRRPTRRAVTTDITSIDVRDIEVVPGNGSIDIGTAVEAAQEIARHIAVGGIIGIIEIEGVIEVIAIYSD